MLFRSVYDSFMGVKSNSWKTGVRVLGLAEGGVGWALDEHNASLITPEMKARVESAKQDIIAGRIAVHDYMADNECSY